MKNKYIGIDVGGTKILIQVFDEKLRILDEKMVKTDVIHGKNGFFKQICALIDEFLTKSIKGIGIALPGIVNQKTGELVRAPHLPTGRNFKIRDLLKNRYKVAVHADNDINAFLADEYAKPRIKKYKNVLALMVGTGLGGAAIVDGKMMYGANGYAGEFGHIIINKSDTLMSLEQNTSGHYRELYPNIKKDGVRNLGIGLASLNLIFNPDAIVLGGSVYLNHIASKKAELIKIIKKHSLANQSPKLFDADPKTSVARGAVRLIKN
jgi:predicted NBD/HSP70 family sugar kinase